MRTWIAGVGLGVGMLVTQPMAAQMPLVLAAGPTFTNISSDEYETSSKTGFFVAVGTSFQLNETFSIDPNVAYVQKGAEFDDGGSDSYDYLELAPFLTANIPVGESAILGLSAGPQVSFNISCEESDGSDCSEFDDFNSTDFGVLVGAQIGFPLSESTMLGVGGGADFGLSDIFDSVPGGYKNRAYWLSAAIGFLVGG